MKRLISVTVVLIMVLMSLPASAGGNQNGHDDKLSKHDRELLTKAQVAGQPSVTMLIAAVPGANPQVSADLAALGGSLRYSDDDLGYIRIRVPIAKVEAAAKLAGIQSVNLDELIPLDDPAPEAADHVEAVAPPGPGTPAQNAYMPTRDIGAPQFVAANPTYDGRGVTIGILDTGIDLFTPELQTAKQQNGKSIRKFADWVTFTDPIDDNDPTWINMKDEVTATGGTFTYQGVTYTAPANGKYRIGLLKESDDRLGDMMDLNLDGNTTGIFAVLWQPDSQTVWVDTNQNHTFVDDMAMSDYKDNNHDVNQFGTDDPATPERESVPFVVQTDQKNMFVNIGIVSGDHGTHVAGIAAGKGFFGGAYNGAAPEAQIVSVRVCMFVGGCTAHGLIEGMIYAAKQAHSDVINMSIGGLPALNDGNNTRAVLYNRLIEKQKVQMFISAGNSGAGVNTVGDPSVATLVMSVGASVNKDTWLNNYGAVATKVDGLFVFSSRGPREDGGFKPDIVAPGAAVSSIPGYLPGSPVAGTYSLPPGYGMFNGTSMASPMAAGGAALLVSAAKQKGVQYKPEQLRQAIKSSARYLAGYGAYEQGNGLFQVGAAWDMLKTNIKTAVITSKAPVNTILSGMLATPNQGLGIYEREGWAPGQSGQRTITLTRTAGGSKSGVYTLNWIGNDGTFVSAGSISLPLNTPVSLPVTISPATAGVHSAILNVDDANTTGIDYQIMNTVVAAEQFGLANNYTVTRSGHADRPDFTTFFFNVPTNTPALKVSMQVPAGGGRVRLQRFHPYGVLQEPASGSLVPAYCTGPCSYTRTLQNPTPGVWEVTVDTSRTSLVSVASFSVTAQLMGTDVSPTAWTVDPTTVGTTYSQPFTFTNRFGAFTGGAVGTALASAKADRPTIAVGAQQFYDITVPAGSTSVSARIGGPSDAGADLDLYLYDCTSGTCALKSSSAGSDANEFVSSANPTSGLWKVMVDGYAAPTGSTAYDYLDVIAHPMFGTVSVVDPADLHPSNSSWTVTANSVANAAPSPGRFLQGFVQVKSGSSVLGSAEVQLKQVSP